MLGAYAVELVDHSFASILPVTMIWANKQQQAALTQLSCALGWVCCARCWATWVHTWVHMVQDQSWPYASASACAVL